MTYGSFLFPPQIHLEQEDPLNLDEENDKIVESVLNSKRTKTSISALWLLSIKCLFRRGNLLKSSAPYLCDAWWTKPRGAKIFLGVLLYIYFDYQNSFCGSNALYFFFSKDDLQIQLMICWDWYKSRIVTWGRATVTTSSCHHPNLHLVFTIKIDNIRQHSIFYIWNNRSDF